MSKPKLLRDIALVVVAKFALVAAAGAFVFGPGDRPRIDAGVMAGRMLGPSITHSSTKDRAP